MTNGHLRSWFIRKEVDPTGAPRRGPSRGGQGGYLSRLILASHRLPVTVNESGRARRSAGGLVAALSPLHEASGSALWFGAIDEQLARHVDYPRIVPVPLPDEMSTRHYEGFSNGVLWPLFHYLPEFLGMDGSDWAAYRRVNELFAQAIVEQALPDDTIWVHDYQLMLLPQMLRERLPAAKIGFFLHIPFPSSEVFRVLPVAKQLLDGLAGADVVGLQTHGDALNLVTALGRIAGKDFDEHWTCVNGHPLKVASFPIGVDAQALAEEASDPATREQLALWKDKIGGRKVILGIDRMDYTKGLTLRLAAYRKLLETEPRFREDAVLLQVAIPSRSGIPRYAELKEEVERAVGEINGRFGVGMTAPIRYIYGTVSPNELSALYQLADVALVTPVRDGMNLVAKEYVASRLEDTGTLILSEFAGAAAQLGEALLTNPWDVDGTARAVKRALEMEEGEQRRRMTALRRVVASEDVHRWSRLFLKSLGNQSGRAPVVSAESGPSWSSKACSEFREAKRRLLVLDYDGTLREFTEIPADAVPSRDTLELLARLAEAPSTDVAIVSGREQGTLEEWFGHLPVHLAAEHGAYFRLRGQASWEQLEDMNVSAALEPLRTLFEEYVSRTPGSRMEEKRTSLSWHYRAADAELAIRQARELVHNLRESPGSERFEVLRGDHVIEVRPRGIHKGRAFEALRLVQENFEFVLVAGDDRTDEDMFARAHAKAWTVKVGDAPTAARYRLEGPEQLRGLLRSLVSQDPPQTSAISQARSHS